MRRTALLLSVALVVAAVAAVPAGGLAAGDGVAAQQTTATETPADDPAGNQTDGHEANDSDPAVAPGERLGGVVAVGQSEFETEVDSRAFGLRVRGAATDNATADVVSEKLAEIRERVDRLERHTSALQQAHENGSLSDGAYRARMAHVAAELRGAERLANQTANASQRLPVALLEANGINATAIQTLRERASQLGGPAVAEIARSIAGPAVGQAPGRAVSDERRPDDRGPTVSPRGPPANATDTEARADRTATDRSGNRTGGETATRERGPATARSPGGR